MRVARLAALTALLLAFTSCGGGGYDGGSPSPSPSPATPSGPTINIQGMAFSPLALEVAPGAVVTVRNLDSMAHSVTSQSAAGAFAPGAASGVSFDTGPFVGTATITIPASTAVGTTISYYCTTHLGTMVTPNGEIRVVAAPSQSTEAPSPGDPGYTGG